jgi:hypothetical protein
MEDENVILSFKGIVTTELLTSVLHTMETKMDAMNVTPRIRKKVFNILVESLQNIYHHAEESTLPESKETLERKTALVLIMKEQNHFIVKTGNYIDVDKVKELKDRIDNINSLDKDGLKEYYQSSLSNSMVSSKGNAGLGMIDIARKSGNKLGFEFLKINNQTSFFCLNVKIDE